MTKRPSMAAVCAELAALAVALVVGLYLAGDANWDPALFGLLLVLGIAGDLTALDVPSRRLAVSGSFLAILTATVFLGPTPGALIGVTTILCGWVVERYAGHVLLINLVTFAWFPLIVGAAFHLVVQDAGLSGSDASFYLLVFAMFIVALAINFSLIAGYFSYQERSSFRLKVRRSLAPLLPSELASALLAVGLAYAYFNVGLAAIALFAIVLGVFQYLLGALLVSQGRADELELKARQLAGFQVALLSALLRTLDLRDRITARHSAAVARYSREIAQRAGLSEHDQELAHTAGLLHDIGKFMLPDEILKSRGSLTPEQWEQVRRHPDEGARIVSQIDGYTPVGDIILAHHERPDGLGYPHGLKGEEVPEIARVVAVADAYDAMTARDSYRRTLSSSEAIVELKRVAGSQLDARFVEAFIEILAEKDAVYRHGEDADFDAELALDTRIQHVVSPEAIAPRQPLPERELF